MLGSTTPSSAMNMLAEMVAIGVLLEPRLRTPRTTRGRRETHRWPPSTHDRYCQCACRSAGALIRSALDDVRELDHTRGSVTNVFETEPQLSIDARQQLASAPEHQRVHVEVESVDEVGGDELLHERTAAEDCDVAVGVDLQLRH